MKKLTVALLTVAISLSLTACGEKTNVEESTLSKEENTTNVEEVVITEEETIQVEEADEVEAVDVSVGEMVTLDFVSMMIDNVEVSADGYEFSYTEGSVTKKASIDVQGGMDLVCIRGKFTNLSSKERYPSNDPVYGKMYINGNEYSMRLRCYNSAEAESQLAIAAGQEVDMYFYAEVPENISGNIESCEVVFGFLEELEPGYVAGLEDLDYLYKLETIPTGV